MRTLVFIIVISGCSSEEAREREDAGGLSAADTAPPTSARCERHSDCRGEALCGPSHVCIAGLRIGDGECRSSADCPSGEVCDERYTRCVVGECGHDLDCDPPHCDVNGLLSAGTPTCVECESDAHCASGACEAGRCAP